MRDCLILGYLLLQVACTQATPDLKVLNEDNIPRPTFSGSTTKSLGASSTATTFNIQGECDSKIRALQGTAVGTATSFSGLTAMSTSGLTVTCATNGQFSFQLKSLADLGYTAVEGQTYEIQIRGETSGGISKASYIRILYSTQTGGRPILITSGSNTATGGALSAEVRLSNKQNATAAVSGDDTNLKTGPGGLSATVGVKINY